MKVVFMGTPDFAVASLEKLLEDGLFSIRGVVTQPDRPKGRGQKPGFSPVKKTSLRHNLRVWQPESISDDAFQKELSQVAPDVIAVVAFGQKIPPQILNMPPFGCINVHASLLPRYRGSSPIHRAVINGETETGVTTIFMNEGWDEGDVIYQFKIPVGTDETVGELHDRLAREGALLLVKTLRDISVNCAPRILQDHTAATYAYKLKSEESNIDWAKPARSIHNLVRGMNPWPLAQTIFRGKMLKIWRTSLIGDTSPVSARPGEIVKTGKNILQVACGQGYINLEELQPESGKHMTVQDYIGGYRPDEGEVFGE
ncbi:MAG: methionyl-tRNA formyltransferase [Bacillota bacterium]